MWSPQLPLVLRRLIPEAESVSRMQNVAWSLGATARRITAWPGSIGTALAGSPPPGDRGNTVASFIASNFDAETLARRVIFEIEDESAEAAELTLLSDAGLNWAEAEQWIPLAEAVTQAERSRAKTRGGVRHRAILMTGALRLIDRAILAKDDDAIRQALASFQMAYSSAPRNPVLAALAARANIGVAWSIRDDRPIEIIPQDDRVAMDTRIERAQNILRPFKPLGGAILGEARYRAAVMDKTADEDLPALYRDWTDADPEDAIPMEMHGFFLLPRWGGSHENIELEARRAALRTEPTIGYAGYAMLTLPLLEHEPELLTAIEPALFAEGIDDWLSTFPEPGRVNAYLREIVNILNAHLPHLDDQPALQGFKDHLAQTLPRLIETHLRRVVLSAWDDEPDWIRSVIAYCYNDHIQSGGTVAVTSDGIRCDAATGETA